MKQSEIFNKVVEDICSIPFFSDYKYRKRDYRFSKKTSLGVNWFELQHWLSYDEVLALKIYPVIGVRINILMKWFERFSFKKLQEQRDNYTFGFWGGFFGVRNEFYFRLDGSNYDSEFSSLVNTLTTCMQSVERAYSTLEDAFKNEIMPVLRGEKKLHDTGADWIFEYLTLCKLVAPEMYDDFRALMLEHVKWMYGRKEPNVERYYDRLDEILSYMETPGNIK